MRFLTVLLLLAVTADAKPPKAAEGATTAAPSDTIRLRSAFDADPSSYLGRFVAPGSDEVDETAAMPTLCSQYVSYKEVGGGNVTYDELVEVSSKVAARFNIPLIASGGGKSDTAKMTRVKYTLTRKLMAEISDPGAFATCCTDNPDQCTDRLVGEFLEGTGEVFRVVSSSAEGGVDVKTPQGGGAASMALGHHWEQSIQFPEPVYFAFKITQTPYRKVGNACGAWVSTPPVLEGGSTFVGVARKPQKTEQAARRKAVADAKQQAVKAGAGMAPETKLNEVMNVVGLGKSAMKRKMENAREMDIEAREWCVEQDPNGEYVARVLAFVDDKF